MRNFINKLQKMILDLILYGTLGFLYFIGVGITRFVVQLFRSTLLQIKFEQPGSFWLTAHDYSQNLETAARQS